jgi:uncharacterized protein (DUF1800 family)
MVAGLDPAGALVAFQRFGLGARPGDLAEAARDPRGFVRAELGWAATPPVGADLLSTEAALAALFEDQERVKAERERAAAAAQPAMATPAMTTPAMAPPPSAPAAASAPAVDPKPKPAEPSLEQKLFRAEAAARLKAQVEAGVGFVERLVAFWSNHFAVSVAKDQFVRVAAGPFEREAIRPHVLGRFADMLRAVERHPAMLHYLDNQQSVGPDSKAGQNRRRGLNENLAREILELHTLGVGGGYSQADVTSFARVITGWTVAGRDGRQGAPGSFVFNAAAHQPGPATVVGRTYAQEGEAQGEAVIADLARAPATARHVATKLVAHFVADRPPQRLVDRIAAVFHDSDGDLKAVALALLGDDEAWSAPATKLRTPSEFLVAMMRATGAPPADPGPVLHSLNALGQPLWQPSGPNGFPDTVAAWAAPEAMKLRLDVAFAAAGRVRDIGHPISVLDSAIGLAASSETREAVSRAETRQQALTLVFMSPEFQRR